MRRWRANGDARQPLGAGANAAGETLGQALVFYGRRDLALFAEVLCKGRSSARLAAALSAKALVGRVSDIAGAVGRFGGA